MAAVEIVDVRKRFELLGRTGQGSMSKVWRARDKKLGRVVCLKILDKVKTFREGFAYVERPPSLDDVSREIQYYIDVME